MSGVAFAKSAAESNSISAEIDFLKFSNAGEREKEKRTSGEMTIRNESPAGDIVHFNYASHLERLYLGIGNLQFNIYLFDFLGKFLHIEE